MDPQDRKYSKEHEWVKVEGRRGRIGITDYAQQELGDVVNVELPQMGSKVRQFNAFGVVESVKAVQDLYAPVSGTIVAVNEKLKEAPELINSEPYGEGWMLEVEIENLGELGNLLSAADYQKELEKKP